MTADYFPSTTILGRTATRIINEVGHQLGGLRHYIEAARYDRVGRVHAAVQ
jgi:hypothetical protein